MDIVYAYTYLNEKKKKKKYVERKVYRATNSASRALRKNIRKKKKKNPLRVLFLRYTAARADDDKVHVEVLQNSSGQTINYIRYRMENDVL